MGQVGELGTGLKPWCLWRQLPHFTDQRTLRPLPETRVQTLGTPHPLPYLPLPSQLPALSLLLLLVCPIRTMTMSSLLEPSSPRPEFPRPACPHASAKPCHQRLFKDPSCVHRFPGLQSPSRAPPRTHRPCPGPGPRQAETSPKSVVLSLSRQSGQSTLFCPEGLAWAGVCSGCVMFWLKCPFRTPSRWVPPPVQGTGCGRSLRF